MQNKRLALDQAIIANTKEIFQIMIDEANRDVKQCGMQVNIKKTKTVKIKRSSST